MARLFLILSLISLCISSCCTMKDCDDSIGFTIMFQGFDTAEVDTVDLMTYNAGTGYTNAIDSSRLYVYSASIYGLQIFPSGSTNFDKEYKLVLSSSGDEYTISDFETKKEACNHTLIINTPCSYFNSLHSYKVNGNRIEGGDGITITK